MATFNWTQEFPAMTAAFTHHALTALNGVDLVADGDGYKLRRVGDDLYITELMEDGGTITVIRFPIMVDGSDVADRLYLGTNPSRALGALLSGMPRPSDEPDTTITSITVGASVTVTFVYGEFVAMEVDLSDVLITAEDGFGHLEVDGTQIDELPEDHGLRLPSYGRWSADDGFMWGVVRDAADGGE